MRIIKLFGCGKVGMLYINADHITKMQEHSVGSSTIIFIANEKDCVLVQNTP
jgi:selenocysteine lyase/cysteine desulfurase